MNTEDTLSLDNQGPVFRPGAQPQLFTVLQCQNILAPPSRHGLADLDEVVIGRGTPAFQRDCERGVRRLVLRVSDQRMSSTHARLRRSGESFVLEDTGSKNGSIVNGQSHGQVLLADGDLVQLGCTFFSFRYTGADRGDFTPAIQPGAPLGMTTMLPELAESFVQLEAMARTTVPILILGESGTGKELVARALHELSERPGPFVAVNCGALPSTLVEAELFGYRKGAFSGAAEDRPGLVRVSDHGTLLLDEIGDLPLSAQPALLRVLQEREVMAVGATRATSVDLRVISATHRDLECLGKSGGFRADLRARLDGYTVRLPPLCERREDMGLLIASLLSRIAGERAASLTLSPSVGRSLLAHSWPLNVRELEQRLTSAMAMNGDEINVCNLGNARSSTSPPRPTPAGGQRSLSAAEQAQRDELLELLKRHHGNISAVARNLGKERIQIRRWIRRYGINPT
jgi:transcriptional regulator of acetoin/glycerol metabolism